MRRSTAARIRAATLRSSTLRADRPTDFPGGEATDIAGALGVGFLLGLRHATDPDHLAAVSTLVVRQRSVVPSCLLGTFWGAGHTAALLAVGLVVIVFRLTLPPAVEHAAEAAVAVMLVGLGLHVVVRARAVPESADPAGAPPAGHVMRLGSRPFAVGLLHGLAGSAGLLFLTLASVPTPLGGVLFILVFGVGSTAGMLLLSGVIALPVVLSIRSASLVAGLRTVAGTASLVLGLWMLARTALG
jgi:hypothetical protein